MMTKVEWPDLTFPAVNLYVVIPALEFKQLVEEYGVPDSRYRKYYLSEGEPVQQAEQDVLSRSEESG